MNRIGTIVALGALLLGTTAATLPAATAVDTSARAAAEPMPMDTSARAAAMVSPTGVLLATKNVDSVRRAADSPRGGEYCVKFNDSINYSSSVLVVTPMYGSAPSANVILKPPTAACGGEPNTVEVQTWSAAYARLKDSSFTIAVL
ncbi:hypothetical protein [Streptomyces sp. NPDC019539]|uniref:hypothetical protein n=1 Tax=Streptomyces sp. NPDC019539 TaxID=3365063 RepID=UPI0037947490